MRLGIAVGVAASLAAADLVVEAAVHADTAAAHLRSPGWIVLSAALVAFAFALTWLPSRLLALGAGVFAGGLLGNVVTAVAHHRVVANPFVVGDVAFNVADVLVLMGIVVLIVAAMRLALRYRELLPRHTIPVRIVRYAIARCAGARITGA